MERPTFQQVLKELNSISPQKGDLMDNLVNMVRSSHFRQACTVSVDLLSLSLPPPPPTYLPTVGEIFD